MLRALIALYLLISLAPPALADAREDYRSGLEQYRGGDYDDAIEELSEAIAGGDGLTKKQLANAFNVRGLAFIEIRHFGSAMADFGRSLQVNPDQHEAYFNRGLLNERKGERINAIADYGRALAQRESFALGYLARGRMYFALGNTTKAISDYDRALEFDPEYAEAYYNRGLVREAVGQEEAAVEDYRQAYLLLPNEALTRAKAREHGFLTIRQPAAPDH